jgi:hypothetical protein
MHKRTLRIIYGSTSLFEPFSDCNQKYALDFEASTKAECEADIVAFLEEWRTSGFFPIGIYMVPFHQIKQVHIST